MLVSWGEKKAVLSCLFGTKLYFCYKTYFSRLKLLAVSDKESSILFYYFLCSLTPQQATGNRVYELLLQSKITKEKLGPPCRNGSVGREANALAGFKQTIEE